ncbi:ABC transporter ATP-binding protein [Listeria monocytogenes]|jgi:ABC-type multidrug transport system, ATPase component|uniref:Lmo0756 protein n=5 Tax=Listeria monocytogenes TaxID=1639 RepID=Q8Y8Y6_LISMO|nr:ABC transporter ATP-binding protein [Listeria monocytogenes]NP_464283.1 ABC transporter ATP-binding protein [Listeria monocytogenes EGD-e]EAD3236903.1 ABC transporter ATP-binding protein [Listeria monocytogenes CFSAN002202]EAD5039948.1 ABC transporter ATP-binding protein [Listeria monocytogenes serotype 1/2a]EAE3702594.1 ABC transporter ATP-binding protein [Listeria monocytogenes serotype 1/2c]EAE6023433.1 ABC transporter ATP-binding protein [Listeria monocytogenes serotype 3a]EAG6270454.1
MTERALQVTNLHKKIRKREIIKGISFEVMPGEVFGFLGPNGAGKTTTIRMIVGLIKPTSGTILIGGKDIRKNFTEAMRGLGSIVENPEFYTFLTGQENLAYFARMDSSIKKERIQEVTELVGLEKRINDRVSTYSLGMRQRLGIAQALLSNPKLLILDEPTNGLDPSGIHEMRDFIRALARNEGISVLVSSHLLSEIELLCDRVAIMTDGTIIKTDQVAHLLSSRAQLRWRVTPIEQAKAFLESVTEVEVDGEYLVTAMNEESAEWNEQLVAKGIKVHEIDKRKPSLEDLFLELTGGQSID